MSLNSSLKSALAVALLFTGLCLTSCKPNALQELATWLQLPPQERPSLDSTAFANTPLSQAEAHAALELLEADRQAQLLAAAGSAWEARLLRIDTLEMPFSYQVFGEQPADGRSLFISLHGGGGAPAAINDQQYRNQQHLYDRTMVDLEGVYLAPRAPTNTWDLWHQDHLDDFLNQLIQLAVIKEGVNPNKVYLLGYSAGGDGVYQLTPRMADHWAAASMMAGHPNETSPLGFRNVPFAIHMGALDSAYNRNSIAATWGKALDSLAELHPDGYIHQVQLHEGFGHWMHFEDSVALSWMQQFKRNPIPQHVAWVQDNRLHDRHYWLGASLATATAGDYAEASFNPDNRTVTIKSSDNPNLTVFLNDAMTDLDQPVTIIHDEQVIFKGPVKRTIRNLYQTLHSRGDPQLAFPAQLRILDQSRVVEE